MLGTQIPSTIRNLETVNVSKLSIKSKPEEHNVNFHELSRIPKVIILEADTGHDIDFLIRRTISWPSERYSASE
jgi:hypothetical protein